MYGKGKIKMERILLRFIANCVLLAKDLQVSYRIIESLESAYDELLNAQGELEND